MDGPDLAVTETALDRLGAVVGNSSTRFTVQSGVAERIELCLFDAMGREDDRVDLSPQSAS